MRIILLCILLLGCSSPPKDPNVPTPFEVNTSKKIVLPGCEVMKKEAEDWNRANSEKEPRIADC